MSAGSGHETLSSGPGSSDDHKLHSSGDSSERFSSSSSDKSGRYRRYKGEGSTGSAKKYMDPKERIKAEE